MSDEELRLSATGLAIGMLFVLGGILSAYVGSGFSHPFSGLNTIAQAEVITGYSVAGLGGALFISAILFSYQKYRKSKEKPSEQEPTIPTTTTIDEDKGSHSSSGIIGTDKSSDANPNASQTPPVILTPIEDNSDSHNTNTVERKESLTPVVTPDKSEKNSISSQSASKNQEPEESEEPEEPEEPSNKQQISVDPRKESSTENSDEDSYHTPDDFSDVETSNNKRSNESQPAHSIASNLDSTPSGPVSDNNKASEEQVSEEDIRDNVSPSVSNTPSRVCLEYIRKNFGEEMETVFSKFFANITKWEVKPNGNFEINLSKDATGTWTNENGTCKFEVSKIIKGKLDAAKQNIEINKGMIKSCILSAQVSLISLKKDDSKFNLTWSLPLGFKKSYSYSKEELNQVLSEMDID